MIKKALMKIYVGYDSREDAAFRVAKHSIMKRTRRSTRVAALKLAKVGHVMNRPIEWKDGKMWCPISQAPMATEFAVSRFSIPLIHSVTPWAMFVDCDVVCLADVHTLFKLRDDKYAVMVVKHDHQPAEATKMVNQTQTVYPRKNWSSLVLWNTLHPANKALTQEVLNTWPGRDLHAFKWLKDEEIGAIPPEWNYLVGDDAIPEGQKLVHYTKGGPWIDGWVPKPSDNVWNEELAAYNAAKVTDDDD